MAKYGQAVISRETRLLLVTIIVAVASLWVLARLRVQDRPAAAVPVPPVLAQLRPTSSYDDLTQSLASLRAGISAALASVDGRPALRIDAGSAVRLNQLVLERVPVERMAAPLLSPWTPRIIDYPRYLVAADRFDGTVALRPVYVGSIAPVESAFWRSMIWRLPDEAEVPPGTFVFTLDGQLAGLSVGGEPYPALLPPEPLLSAASQLEIIENQTPGWLGLDVTQTAAGLVVAHVAPDGPAHGRVAPSAIIDAIDGRTVQNEAQWTAGLAHVRPGETIAVRVRNGEEVRDVTIGAAPQPERLPEGGLGLRLRPRTGRGLEVLSVDAGSRAAQAGVLRGDLLVAASGAELTSTSQIEQLFEAVAPGQHLVVASMRGPEPRVAVFRK